MEQEIFKEFINNIRLLGIKDKNISTKILSNNNIQKYKQFFLSLNDLMEEMLNESSKSQIINKNEFNLYETKIKNDKNINELNNDEKLLNLNIDYLEYEDQILENELNELEKNIENEEKLLKKEEKENNFLSEKINKLSESESKYFESQINNFNKNIVKKITTKTNNINKNINKIITEFDLNIKKEEKYDKNLIGFRKIEDLLFEQTFNLIENNLNNFEEFYKNSSKKNNNKNNFDVKIFQELNERINLLSETEFELKKFEILNNIKLSKEKYKNELLNEYIKNNNILTLYEKNTKTEYELEKEILKYLEYENNKIQDKYTKIQNKYSNEIFENILLKNFQPEIKCIEDFDIFENILNSIYPYILDDLNITQNLYDIISNVVDLYKDFQLELSLKETNLRKYYSKQNEQLNKITIDDNDKILLSFIDKNDNNNKNSVKVYEIKNVLNHVNNFLNNFNVENYDYRNEIINNSKIMLNFIKEFKNKSKFLKNVSTYNKLLINYQFDTKNIIDKYNEGIKKIIKQNLKKNKKFSLYEIMYMYLFNKNIYIKEIGNVNVFK